MRSISIGKILGIVLGCVAMFTITPTGLTQTPDGKALKNPTKSTAVSIEAGKKTYTTSCVPCHGASGKGDGPVAASLKEVKPSNLVDEKWEHGSTDGEIFLGIRDGIGPAFKMKAFKGKIADPDIWNVVNYIRSIGPKK